MQDTAYVQTERKISVIGNKAEISDYEILVCKGCAK
jgi:hypothetical protein